MHQNVNDIIIIQITLFGHVQRMEENRIPKMVLYMNLGTTRLRGRSRNRWQDEVTEDGTTAGEGWQEKLHKWEEWKKLLRTARNHRILHVPIEWMTGCDWGESDLHDRSSGGGQTHHTGGLILIGRIQLWKVIMKCWNPKHKRDRYSEVTVTKNYVTIIVCLWCGTVLSGT